MNSDMDRYLRERRRSKSFTFIRNTPSGPSWWDRMFAPKELPADELNAAERAKLHAMETEIKQGERRIEHAAPSQEPELERIQEERVSLYQQFRNLFKKEHQLEEAYEHIEVAQAAPDVAVTDDFRKLAQIQIRWFERLPARVKEEFKESEDYQAYLEILQRRGVAKRK